MEVQAGSVVVAHLHSGESITGAFAVSFDEMVRTEERVLFPPIRSQSNSDLAAARNQVVSAFLNQTPGEWLFWLDDDMGFDADIVARLLDVADPETKPVVGGLCFAYRRYEVGPAQAHRFIVKPTIYSFVESSNEVGFVAHDDYPRDDVVKVDATGSACILIHRSVLDGMREQIGPNWYSHIVLPKGPSGRTELSEDLSFCFRLLVAGVPVYVNTAAKTSHMKPIFLDEWYFENQPTRLVEPELAVVGTGRSGTGFISEALSAVGVKCGHEQWWNVHGAHAPGLLADASWIATNYLDEFDGKVWHQVRNPLAVIASMVGNELFDPDDDRPDWVVPYESERRKWAGYDPDWSRERKALSVVRHWWETAEKHAERTWRVEDFTPGLLLELADEMGRKNLTLSYCRAVLDTLGTDVNKHVDHDNELGWDDLPECDDKDRVREMAAGFGYDV